MMELTSKIHVAGHCGMVGSAIVRELRRQGYTNIITRTHKELSTAPTTTIIPPTPMWCPRSSAASTKQRSRDSAR